ncbi:hypothetical protein CERSUDRAFT_112807 [Gelatoporia subvermispora B]|uniref:RRM domain-containing protein n=1 Tax=Ceriporiopsis subvermispora (strain B) TaxID=914234 RepID=M2RKW4_CERS8|nr:hypothetical protein CERSUDRAFT_112807 [Gelatoporia subvermispora B]
MSEETITKRVHVSGLTPAITAADISQRLSSFGTVRSVDGFGALDAVGQPRKFGYITLETTKSKLAKCMNILSGATWKGAKLRLGEAKPDFRERIARENEAQDEPPTKKRRLPRGVHGVHSADMSLVTPENAVSRPGWHVTPLGRVVRPVRMRPEHPLPPLVIANQPAVKSKGKKADEAKAKKKRAKEPPTRARRRTIDPLKYGSTQLKGAFLESVVVDRQNIPAISLQQDLQDETDESEEEIEDTDGEESVAEARFADVSMNEAETSAAATPVPTKAAPAPHSKPAEPVATPVLSLPLPKSVPASNALSEDLIQEKTKTLGLLASIFGSKGDADWGDKESISDVDMEEHTSHAQVPDVPTQDIAESATSEADLGDVDTEEQATPEPKITEQESESPPKSGQLINLKDLFAPREDAGFSLLGHLDLDLELDEEVEQQIIALAQPVTVTRPSGSTPARPAPSSSLQDFDTKRPFFFPLPPEERNRGRARDALDTSQWRTFFYRTESSDEIRKRWEETRGELTSGWKRRHREAVKSRRRRGGVGGDGE